MKQNSPLKMLPCILYYMAPFFPLDGVEPTGSFHLGPPKLPVL